MAGLVIRADANSTIGTGHFMRCLALAQAWRASGGWTTFVTDCPVAPLRSRLEALEARQVNVPDPHPAPADLAATLAALDDARTPGAADGCEPWLVLDGYHFDPEYQSAVMSGGSRLLVIDDLAHLPHYHADLLLNQNIGSDELSYPCTPSTKRLLGTRYVLLREEFRSWGERSPMRVGDGQHVLVTLGGADPDNVALKVIHGLGDIVSPSLEVRVVVGPANPHYEALLGAVKRSRHQVQLLKAVSEREMPALMDWADAAIAAAGSTCLELAFMGVPMLLLVLADNQLGVARRMSAAGAARFLGHPSALETGRLAATLRDVLLDVDCRKSLVARAQELVDGGGAQRVVAAMRQLC